MCPIQCVVVEVKAEALHMLDQRTGVCVEWDACFLELTEEDNVLAYEVVILVASSSLSEERDVAVLLSHLGNDRAVHQGEAKACLVYLDNLVIW